MAIGWIILSSFLLMHQASGLIINVALRKPVSVSPSHNRRDPGLAVDGNTTAVDPTGVIHTAASQPDAWWWVDLQTQVQDATVRIYFRTNKYIIRRNGVRLYTSTTPFNTYPSGDLCYTVTGSPNGTGIPDVVSVNCSGTWRYLMVYTDTDNSVKKSEGPILDFGEVEVLVCSNETYGANCTKSCSRQCSVTSTSCDRYTGTCPGGCRAGWMGADCTQACSNATYGLNCIKSCSARQCSMTTTTCNRYNGTCPGGCRAGWMGTDCTEDCSPGYYGANCVKFCSARKCKTQSSSCDRETGQCPDGCQDGWTGEDCTNQCPKGTFGIDCVSCSTRHCQGESDCSGDGTCSGGCQDGWTLNNCTQACSVGSHCPDCTLTCGNCSGSDVCDQETGKCPGHCNAGWRGSQCKQPCDREHYGRDCSGECVTRHCEGASTCSPSTGQCDAACQTGWSGVDCTELESRSSEVDRTPLVAGTVTAVVVIIIIVIVVIGLMWRRRRLKGKETRGLDHVYYNDVDASVKVKEDASTEIADHSVPVGEYESIDMSRDTGSPYTTMDSVINKDNQDSVGEANTMSDINGRHEYEPVIARTYEKLDTLSHDGVYTDLHGHSSYENLKGRDK